MPSVKHISDKYRFFFYSFDCNEPEHVHIQREEMICKFWLEPIALCRNYGFSSKELNAIQKIIMNNKNIILKAWNEHCNKYSGNTH